MLDKSTYLRCLEHAKGTEKSVLMAYKLDDADGIAEQLGFKTHIISKADYFLEQELHVQFIELSDLRESFKECAGKICSALAEINQDPTLSEKWKRERKKVIKQKAWQNLRDEFHKKWNGSIAVIERLYRKTGQPVDSDPRYSLLIVCKNDTDTKMLDELNAELSPLLNGMCGTVQKVQFCKTSQLEKCLLTS
ncbi:hypothetical protein [Methylovulum psychrotolerans]|uniref:Uncharacterized protein n=1 Tax=Methylovulum psychrotolerans TaxID=1704499 RepID=A0A1Z4C1F3_9GAMM|nr:hypothetical protein [Methylovulum psychrotolerans]ASF47330.1 hypothetical protein CEK71_15360 [Methylovulum psychrotolerans]